MTESERRRERRGEGEGERQRRQSDGDIERATACFFALLLATETIGARRCARGSPGAFAERASPKQGLAEEDSRERARILLLLLSSVETNEGKSAPLRLEVSPLPRSCINLVGLRIPFALPSAPSPAPIGPYFISEQHHT